MPAVPSPNPSVQYQRQTMVHYAARCTAHTVPDAMARHHEHIIAANQCCSAMVRRINAPITAVWSVLHRFDNPQAHKNFLKSCHVIIGDSDVGTLREFSVISDLPAVTSHERLEILDDERHVINFHVVDGEHRLDNYRLVTKLHATAAGMEVVESYVVDVPTGNKREEATVFVDTIVQCNLQSLVRTAEKITGKSGMKNVDPHHPESPHFSNSAVDRPSIVDHQWKRRFTRCTMSRFIGSRGLSTD